MIYGYKLVKNLENILDILVILNILDILENKNCCHSLMENDSSFYAHWAHGIHWLSILNTRWGVMAVASFLLSWRLQGARWVVAAPSPLLLYSR